MYVIMSKINMFEMESLESFCASATGCHWAIGTLFQAVGVTVKGERYGKNRLGYVGSNQQFQTTNPVIARTLSGSRK